MDSFCGTSRIYFVREIFLRILNISLKHLLTLEKTLINTFFISFAKVMQSKSCQYCCGNTFKLEFNFFIQNTPSSFRTSIGTFNRVSCFTQHTIKNCLCIRFRLCSRKPLEHSVNRTVCSYNNLESFLWVLLSEYEYHLYIRMLVSFQTLLQTLIF